MNDDDDEDGTNFRDCKDLHEDDQEERQNEDKEKKGQVFGVELQREGEHLKEGRTD